MMRKMKVGRASELLASYNAIHARPKLVKDNSGALMVPYVLSGRARHILNDNIAALLVITKPLDEAIEVLRKQYLEERDKVEAAIKQEQADPEDQEKAIAINATLSDARFDKEVREMWAREKEVDLEPIQRGDLNESANAFDPLRFADLRNEGLIIDKKPVPAATPKIDQPEQEEEE